MERKGKKGKEKEGKEKKRILQFQSGTNLKQT
jgi:hypothetical protein